MALIRHKLSGKFGQIGLPAGNFLKTTEVTFENLCKLLEECWWALRMKARAFRDVIATLPRIPSLIATTRPIAKPFTEARLLTRYRATKPRRKDMSASDSRPRLSTLIH